MEDRGRSRGIGTIASTVLDLTSPAASDGPSPLAQTMADPTQAAVPQGGAKSPATASRPDAAARYELVGELGAGGMGRVDRVRDRDLLRDVAAKYLLPEMRRDRALLEQFLWEARVTAYLDHPNIVPVHELGTTPEGEAFFTMKFARGATLRDLLESLRESDDGVGLTRRLRIFLGVCNAVAFAHSRGILHRDLKPANVLVGEFGEVLVSDWGLALPLENVTDELRAIVPEGLALRSAGTPVYMSPEQARGDALDHRSDVYTLGAILYELIALEHHVGGPSLPELLAKITKGEIVHLDAAKPDVSRPLAAVVHKALAVDPGARYQTAQALADDLETVLDGRTPHADDASLLRQVARYYVAHDPAMARMRVYQIDLWAAAAGLCGAAIAGVFATTAARWWWLLLVVALVVGFLPTRAWLAFRAEDRRRERENRSRAKRAP
jgi:serine/threonine protein kinase